jgi:hypothetical protein
MKIVRFVFNWPSSLSTTTVPSTVGGSFASDYNEIGLSVMRTGLHAGMNYCRMQQFVYFSAMEFPPGAWYGGKARFKGGHVA